MTCTKCHLFEKAISQILPLSKGAPEIYVVFDKPEEDDVRFHEIGHGSRSRYLDSYLTSLGIENYRMWSMVRCLPFDCDYDGTSWVPAGSSVRKPTSEEIEACSEYVKMDIYKHDPKIVIAVGALAFSSLTGSRIPVSKARGSVFEITILDKTFKVIPTYSPTYILKHQNPENSSEFLQDLSKAKQIADGVWVDRMSLNHVEYALTYREFKDFYVRELIDEDMLAYDIETNAELVYSDKFDIIGFSLAKKNSGVYVCLESLDYKMSDEDRKNCRNLLVAILKKTPKIIVHNSLYERPATYYNLGYEMDFDKVEDTLVMVKLMLGGKTGAGLKPNAKKIGYPDWDHDLEDYISNFMDMRKRISLVKYRWIVNGLRKGKSFSEIFDEADEENKSKSEEIINFVNNIFLIVKTYYSDEEVPEIMKLVSQKFFYSLDCEISGVIPYSWIPSKVICAYGATDSLATFDLYDHYMKRFRDESTETVDLNKGYRFALMEHYAGYELMMSGIYWDDKSAQIDYDNYKDICLKTIKYLESDPYVEDDIMNTHFQEFVVPIIYESYNDYFWDNFYYRVVMVTDGQFKMEYKAGNNKTRTKNIKNFIIDENAISPSLMDDLRKRVKEAIRKKVKEETDYEVLKKLFNPLATSPAVKSLVNQILVIEDTRVGAFINKVNNLVLQHEDFNIENYDGKDKEIISMVSDYLKLKDLNDEKRDSYNELKRIFSVLVPEDFSSMEMKQALNAYRTLNYDAIDDPAQVDIYNNLSVGLINPDDPDTWTHEFRWLVDFRLFKKACKVLSAYLEGSVGRQSLYAVDKKSLESGDSVVYRHGNYYSYPLTDDREAIVSDDLTWLEQINFGVGTADTGRWRSAIHVLPPSSTIKRLYVSRFKGGTILQPDFSANEVRCIASAANEKNMLEAFEQGMDIHRSNASKMFGVPMDEVTPFQRRRAKSMTFSTLYGASEFSIAQTNFGGDIDKAKKQINDFYNAFPSIKKWIDEKHQEAKETHKVSTLTHRFLVIDFDPSDRKSVAQAMRKSQNYPIQSLDYWSKIRGLDGKDHTIGELAESNEDLWVYSYDVKNKRIIPVKGVSAQCTGYTDTWYEITLDNGESVKVTPEHKMMLRSGEYRRADELSIGDSLMPLYTDFNSRSSENYYRRIVDGSFDSEIYRKIHEYVYPNVDIAGVQIHHMDFDNWNQSPENLVALSNGMHIKLHRLSYEYFGGGSDRVFEFFKTDLFDYLKEEYQSEDIAQEKIDYLIKTYDNLGDDVKSALAEKSLTNRNKVRNEQFPEWSNNQKAAVSKEVHRRLEETGNVLGMDSEAYSQRLSEAWAEHREERSQRLKEGHNKPESIKAHSDASKKREADPDYNFNRLKKILAYMHENNLPWETPEDWEKSIEKYPISHSRRHANSIENKIGWETFVEKGHDYLSTYNHKITDIKVYHLDKPEKKYDLHVPEYHNFALSCGVFTHNSASSTMAAVVLCDIAMYYRKNNLKSKTICFIHDSLESDVAPYELFKVIEYEKEILAHGGMDYFGVACKADVSMGYSMGHECELLDLHVLDEDKTEGILTLSGYRDEIEDTINNWKLAYNVVEVLSEEYEPVYAPLSQMFMPKRAYDPTIFSEREKGKAKIHIRYYDERGNINPMADSFTVTNLWETSPLGQYLG